MPLRAMFVLIRSSISFGLVRHRLTESHAQPTMLRRWTSTVGEIDLLSTGLRSLRPIGYHYVPSVVSGTESGGGCMWASIIEIE